MDLAEVRDGILGALPSTANAVKAAGNKVGIDFDPRQTIGEFRKAGQLLKANPIGALVTDLVFTEPMADGTMDAYRERHSKIH